MLFLYEAGIAQYPKYIINFIDKNNTPFRLNDPSKYLSQKAIERRNRYNIRLDSSDLPVAPAYIDSVLKKGNVQLLSTSRWLNQILIYCTNTNTIAKIQALPFVKTATGIGLKAGNIDTIQRERFVEKISSANIVANNQQQQGTEAYNYGSTFNQVHIHNGEFLHNKGFNGKGISIAVLDAGFNKYTTIAAFDSVRLNGQILGVKDFVAFDNSVTEDDTHGRYCLSIMAANWPGKMIGTAPKANYWLLRTENAASEYPIEEHNWVAGAEFADSAGADMISSSLGYNQFDDAGFNHTYSQFYKNKTMVSKGASMACNKGLIVMNSAGNEGGNSWKYIIFPADADTVCAVGAIDTTGQIAGFSSYGYAGKIKPNIVSVGVNTVIAGDTQPVAGNGTSFSNPNIAGLIACLWQAFPAYNNITILDAVYKSASRYNNPDNRYGFGVPNMQKAYRLLKHKQNVELFGNEWLFVSPEIFTSTINVKLVGRVDGNATIELADETDRIITTKNIVTEEEEVYDVAFEGLSDLPGGKYFIIYHDSLQIRSLQITKAGIVLRDWLQATPVPFNSRLNVYLNAPETGKVFVRLTDATGKILETQQLDVTQNNQYTIRFKSILLLPKALYFIQYKGTQQKKTIKIIKQQ